MNQQIALPSAEAISAANDLAYEAIVDTADLAVSYAISVREAAWRRDSQVVRIHLEQLRLATITAIQAYKTIGVGPSV